MVAERMNFWVKIVSSVAAIWIVAGGAIYLARNAQPTAASVTKYLQENDLEATSGSARQRVIDRAADMMNRISFEERQQLQRSRVTRDFFARLSPEEQSRYLDATLPSGFRQMMESFNKMEPERRQKMVDRALRDMKRREGEEPRGDFDEAMQQKIVSQGLRSFYSDASADVKLDFAPLIEQMQKNLQGGGR